MSITYTWRDLFNMLTSMERLSIPPEIGERGGCFSSHDRRSTYDADADTYIDWGANDDGKGYIRSLDDGSIVALDLDGPGAVVRSWSAMPGQGHIRIIIDGELAEDTPFIRFFEGFGNDFAPANTPSVNPRLSRGYNRFIPIPFQKHIRIELSLDWGMYFHFTYKLFPENSTVPDYTQLFSRDNRILLAGLDRMLYTRAVHSFTPADGADLIPYAETVIYSNSSAGAFDLIQLKPSDLTAAQYILLKIYWDNDNTPSVCCPLPDFFGTIEGEHHYSSWPCGLVGGVYYCRWYMPFSSGARVTLTALTASAAQRVAYNLRVRDCPDASGRLRFHCAWIKNAWQAYPELPRHRFMPNGDRWPDWPFLYASGTKGRFCGVHLRILDTWKYPEGKKRGEWWFQYNEKGERDGWLDWWWGEGDEKFFVDGEKMPSTFGTGSEDYFGYAWAAEPPFALFDSPFAANSVMPLDGNGVTSAARFHVADDVPFMLSFEGCIERYKGDTWGDGGQCTYAAAPYWYQQTGCPHSIHTPTAEDIGELCQLI